MKSSRVFGLIELREQLARLVFAFARVAAERRQRVGRHRQEVVERQAPRDVFDVRIEAAVLVDHEHGRAACPVALAGLAHVRLDLAVALRRVDLDPLGLDPLVVLGHLLRLGEFRIHQFEQHRRRSWPPTAYFAGAIEEAAAIDEAVHVFVENGPQLWIEVFRGQLLFEFHFASGACRILHDVQD